MKVNILVVVCNLLCMVCLQESCSLEIECKESGKAQLKLNNANATDSKQVQWGNCEHDFDKKVQQCLEYLECKQQKLQWSVRLQWVAFVVVIGCCSARIQWYWVYIVFLTMIAEANMVCQNIWSGGIMHACISMFLNQACNLVHTSMRHWLIWETMCHEACPLKQLCVFGPVLKHGPRSLTHVQVHGWPTCMRNANDHWAVCTSSQPINWERVEHEHVCYDPKDGELCLRKNQGKPWVRLATVLMCKSFVMLGYMAEKLIEPSSSWFPPKVPSG